MGKTLFNMVFKTGWETHLLSQVLNTVCIIIIIIIIIIVVVIIIIIIIIIITISFMQGIFIHIFLRQTMSLGNTTAFQLFCHYYLWCV